MGCTGSLFTWSNRRDETELICRRLDRFVADVNWVSSFPEAVISNLPAISSHHCPVVLNSLGNENGVLRPFRFLAAWTRDESTKQVVDVAWRSPVRDSASFQLCTKIKNTKEALRSWNKNDFGFFQTKLQELQQKLIRVPNGPRLDNYSSIERDLRSNI